MRRLLVLIVLAIGLASPSPAQAAFGYLTKWGSSGTLDGQFQSPLGLATDNSGNVYVADCMRNVVQKFDANGVFSLKWGSTGSGANQFSCARDVAVDGSNVYVLDYGNKAVKRFSVSGVPLSQFTYAGFIQPQGIAADGNGHLFVADSGSGTDTTDQHVFRFATDGTYQATIGSAGNAADQYRQPVTVATDASGFLYVGDIMKDRVMKYDATSGALQTTWGSSGSGDGQFMEPSGVAVDGTSVYVTDRQNNRFQKFSNTGAFLGKWGTAGTGDLQFQLPTELATGPSSTVYIADANNDRIVKYGEGATPAPIVTTGEATGVTWVVGTLHGTVDPQGTATSYSFEYGPTTSYGAQTATTSAGAGTGAIDATGSMVGLMADRDYHYRIVAVQAGSIAAVGEDRTFHTWPDPGSAPGCAPRYGRTIGVVGVCADQLSYDAGRWTASGNVVLNTGVAVSGPVVMNDGLQQITSTGSVTVTVQRGPPVEIGSGQLTIATGGVSDPVSGRSGLGVLSIGNPLRIVLANVSFLPLVTNYLDTTDGGGVIVTARPSFDFLSIYAGSTLPTGSFSIGINRTAAKPFNFLGGSVRWDPIKLSPLWELGFNIGYAEGPPSQLSLMGKFKAPFLPADTGAELSGTFMGGSLDALGIKITTPGVPLGTTGIIMDTFGGSLKGLSGGPNNPIVISVLVGGGWTRTGAPDPFNWVLHIKDVTLTINTAGSGSLSGELDVADGEGRLVKGTASLTLQLAPSFLASGTFDGTFNALLVSASLGFTAAMNTSHFTAQGSVSGTILGSEVTSAAGVLSDKGIGATAHLCVWYWWFGWHRACSDIGAGLTWSKVSSFPPEVDWIGSNVGQYVTLTARSAGAGHAAAATRSFTVKQRDPFLYVEARGSDARDFELVSPLGIHYGPATKRRDMHSQTIGDATAIVVNGPAPGTWRLKSSATTKTRFRLRTIPALGKVRTQAIRPATTKTRPLSAKVKRISLSWRRSGRLPSDTRLSLYVATSPKAPGRLLSSRLRTTGRTTVRVTRLAKGANYLYLVPRSKGVQFGLVRFPKPVWKR